MTNKKNENFLLNVGLFTTITLFNEHMIILHIEIRKTLTHFKACSKYDGNKKKIRSSILKSLCLCVVEYFT